MERPRLARAHTRVGRVRRRDNLMLLLDREHLQHSFSAVAPLQLNVVVAGLGISRGGAMSVTFSTEETTAIANCSRVILSVLDDASTEAWAGRVMDCVRTLLHADRICMTVPGTAGPAAHSYDVLITGSEQNGSELFDQRIVARSTCKPAGLYFDLAESSVPASLLSYKELPTAAPFGERELEILRLLQPSFETAVRALTGSRRTGADPLAYVDRSPAPTLIVDGTRVVRANQAFTSALGEKSRDVVAVAMPRAQALALVQFDLPVRYPITREVLARLGLTPRQTQVAGLMAARRTHKEIATQLGITPNTARRHCEQVLTSLGVHSRHELRQMLARLRRRASFVVGLVFGLAPANLELDLCESKPHGLQVVAVGPGVAHSILSRQP